MGQRDLLDPLHPDRIVDVAKLVDRVEQRPDQQQQRSEPQQLATSRRCGLNEGGRRLGLKRLLAMARTLAQILRLRQPTSVNGY
jgi:hypothetical protein